MHIKPFVPAWHKFTIFCPRRNQALAFASIRQKPFSPPHRRGLQNLPSGASVARPYDSLRGIIIQHNSANPHTARWKQVAADASLGSSGPSAPLIWLMKQHLGCCWFHNNREGEMVVHGWLWIQEPDYYCKEICKLMPRWNKRINVLTDDAKNNDN